jgi:hypothetical protein
MFGQEMILDHFNIQPSMVKGRANAGTEFYKRLLYTKIYSTLDFTLPEGWKKNYFRFWLFHIGSIAVIYTKEFGWVCQPYSIIELDLYYNPKIIQVYNQFITTPKIGAVGVNAGIIKCMDDYFGLDDIVTRYATDLAQCDRSIEVNLMNSNVTAFFKAKSKKDADAIKEAYGQATTGKPFVVVNKEVMDDEAIETLLPNIKNNFIVNDLLQARRGILNAFLTEIGIRNANYDKRERLNSQEVNENNDETSAIISVMYDNIKKSMETINDISGLGLDVKLHYDYDDREVNDNGTVNA